MKNLIFMIMLYFLKLNEIDTILYTFNVYFIKYSNSHEFYHFYKSKWK